MSKQCNSTKPPSVRDQEIHRQVTVSCRRQAEVATQFGLCAGQVSRIVKRVSQWRAGAPSFVQDELSPAAQQRLGRWLARERAEDLYVEARRLVEEAKGSGFGVQGSGGRVGSAHHSATSDGEQVGTAHPTDARLMSLRLQAVKTAMRAGRDAYELSQEEPLPEPKPAADDKHWRKQIEGGLAGLRQAAEAAGRVPKSINPPMFVEGVIQLLLGEFAGYDCSGDKGPGSARWELAASIMRMADAEEWFLEELRASAQVRKLELEAAEAQAAGVNDGVSGVVSEAYGEPAAAEEDAAAAEVAPEKCGNLRASEIAHTSRSAHHSAAETTNLETVGTAHPTRRQLARQHQRELLATRAERYRARQEHQRQLRERRATAGTPR